MAATHPLAIKLEAAISHARRALEALKKAKEFGEAKPEGQWWDWIDSLGRKRINTRIIGNVQLGGIAAAAAERQAFVEGGGGVDSGFGKANLMAKDKQLAALNAKYSKALARCEHARQSAEAQGSKTLSDGSVVAAPGRKGVSGSCPEAAALAKQISEYMARTYGNFGPGQGGSRPSNSGGGGGGGW